MLKAPLLLMQSQPKHSVKQQLYKLERQQEVADGLLLLVLVLMLLVAIPTEKAVNTIPVFILVHMVPLNK